MSKIRLIQEPLTVRVFTGNRIIRNDGARVLGVHPQSCHKLEKDGVLTPIRVGGKVFYRLEEIQSLIGVEDLAGALIDEQV